MAAVLTYFRLYLVATICHTSPECHAVTQLRVVTTPASQELRAAAAGQRSLPGPPEDITLRRDRLVIYLGIHNTDLHRVYKLRRHSRYFSQNV